MANPVKGKDTEPFWDYYEEADYKVLESALLQIKAGHVNGNRLPYEHLQEIASKALARPAEGSDAKA